jgi:hypothetical protein
MDKKTSVEAAMSETVAAPSVADLTVTASGTAGSPGLAGCYCCNIPTRYFLDGSDVHNRSEAPPRPWWKGAGKIVSKMDRLSPTYAPSNATVLNLLQ